MPKRPKRIQDIETVSRSSLNFIRPSKAPRISTIPGLETTILTGLNGEKMMMVLSATLPGRSVPLHSHKNEQIGVVYSGRARLRIGDEERVVEKGDFYRVPANVPHADTCIGGKPFVMLDIFYPVRQDFAKIAKGFANASKSRRILKLE